MVEAAQAYVRGSIARTDWQSVVFAERPRWAGLLELAAADLPTTPLRIHVHRNQPFEPVASCAEGFLRYAGWEPIFSYGPYDDSLSFRHRADADLELVWLDLGRYQEDRKELATWLGERFRHLRDQSDAPILVASLDPTLIPSLPGVLASAYTSTWADESECMDTAREFAFLWLPPVLRPRFKAVVVDLDVTEARLLKTLAELQESGVSLCGTKCQSLGEIAARLRIGLESILYLSDDAEELEEVASEFPEVSLLRAADPAETVRALKLYPGLNGYPLC